MRNFWNDLKIPTDIGRELANIPKEVAKEVTKAMMSQTERIKDEALTMISEEIRNFVDNLDIAEEMRKAMRNSTIELDIRIRFRENESEPEIQQEVTLVPVQQEPIVPTEDSREEAAEDSKEEVVTALVVADSTNKTDES